MKLYNSVGPNPQIVKIVMKELGVKDIELVNVDLLGGENRKEPYLKVNPAGQSPALELDNGSIIAEVTVICEYLNDKYNGDLFGKTTEEKAETRMWLRRIDFNLEMPIFGGFRFAEGLPIFESRIHVIPQAAADLKAIGQKQTMWLDNILADGRKYLCGDRFSAADLWLWVVLNFGAAVGQPINPDAKNVAALLARVGERESCKTTPVMEP